MRPETSTGAVCLPAMLLPSSLGPFEIAGMGLCMFSFMGQGQPMSATPEIAHLPPSRPLVALDARAFVGTPWGIGARQAA